MGLIIASLLLSQAHDRCPIWVEGEGLILTQEINFILLVISNTIFKIPVLNSYLPLACHDDIFNFLKSMLFI